jgi:hypothetical protein
MKLRYKVVLLLSYKFKVHLFKKTESDLTLKIIDFFDHASHPKGEVRYRTLVFDKNDVNLKSSELIEIFFTCIKTRGLIRSLLLASRAIKNEEKIFSASRFDLVVALLKEQKMVRKRLFSHLFYKFMDFNEYELTRLFSQKYVCNVAVIEDFQGLDRYIVEKSYQKKFKFNSIQESFEDVTLVHEFISWNSTIFCQFIKYNQLESFVDSFLLEHFPLIHNQLTMFKRYRYALHEMSALSLDSIHNKRGLDSAEVLFNVDILHQRFILQDNRIVFLDATASPDQNFVSGNWPFIFRTRNEVGFVELLRPAGSSRTFPEAIMLMGRNDENWYHFLLDTAPRVLFFEEVPPDVPVLIRGDLPLSTRLFIKRVLSRELIEVGLDETLEVGKLYVCPGRSTVFDSAPPIGLNWSEFSPLVFSLFRKRVLDSFGFKSTPIDASKISFDRKSTTRNVVNWKTLQKVLNDYSFQNLSLDSKFFEKQVSVFFNANFVVAPGGAVLANILFMQPGSRVLALTSFRNKKLDIWGKLSRSCDLEYFEIRGFPTYWGLSFLRRFHSNFYISPKKLRRILSREI